VSYLTTEETSRRLREEGIPQSPRTLEGHRVRGAGPRYTKLPGLRGWVLYKWSDVLAWVEQGARTSTSDKAA